MLDERTTQSILGFLRKGILTRETLGKIGIAVVLTVILALMFPRGESVDFEYKVGAVWARKDLIAPFSFPILRDDKEYARDVEAAKRKVFDVFERDTLAVEKPGLCDRQLLRPAQ